MDKPDYSDFLYFVDEREQIRWNKEVEGFEAPWTENVILQQYKFCNVRRADDRISRWLLTEYYPKFPAGADYWFAAAVARLINWPPTLKKLLESGAIPVLADDFNEAHFVKTLDEVSASGKKVYGGAYMLYPGHKAGRRKSQFVAEVILREMRSKLNRFRWAVACRSIKEFVKEGAWIYGLNTFMAGQMAADLTYLKGQLSEATDLRTYAPIGPGSSGGLNLLYGRKPNAEWEQGAFNEALIHALRLIEKEIIGLKSPLLTLHDVQNAHCEYFRYARIKAGTTASQRKYKAETEF